MDQPSAFSKYWFAQTKPRFMIEGRPVDLDVESVSPHAGTFRTHEPLALFLGQQLELELKKPETLNPAFCLRACVTHWEKESGKVGLTFLAVSKHSVTRAEGMNLDDVIICPRDSFPIAWGDHPWFFNFRLHFQVEGFFKNGMVLTFGTGIKGILESIELDLSVVLPGVDTFPVKIKLLDVEFDPRAEKNRCRAEFLNPSPEFLVGVARYLFMGVATLTVEQLTAAGFPFPDFEYSAIFGYAYTPEEVREMLALRLLAYRSRPGSTLDGVTDPEHMRDRFDAHSLILSMKVGGRAVGTGRVVFNNGEKDKSEIAQFVALPDWFWEKGFVECSRIATVDLIRGRDIFPNLMRNILRVAYQSGVPYILLDCEEHLLPVYKKRGARELNLTFTHPLENKSLHVIYYDVMSLMKLKAETDDSIQPEMWKTFWGPLVHFLEVPK